VLLYLFTEYYSTLITATTVEAAAVAVPGPAGQQRALGGVRGVRGVPGGEGAEGPGRGEGERQEADRRK
jgi:hypothetical protein